MMGLGFGGIGMFLIMSLIIVVPVGLGIVLLAVLFPKATGNDAMSDPVSRVEPMSTPQEILKLRYARGEISKEQYEQMRRDVDA
ncbi:MAG TPA: SHOCT domain-containing protein [Anaerolineae bacterium]|jgi:putative membrane protein